MDRHCELMSASVYAELCNLDAQPMALPTVRSNRNETPAYIDSSVSGSVIQSSYSTSSSGSGSESNKDWRWCALALSVKVYIMLFKAACRAVRALRRNNCQSMMLSHGAVGPSSCPLVQLISLDPLDQLICEAGWVPTQELTEGLLSNMSIDDLLDVSLGDDHWTCCALRTYHSSNDLDSWSEFHQRCFFNHLRIESLDHQAICAGLLLDTLQLVCCKLRTLVIARVDAQAGDLRSHMCLGTTLLLPLLEACQTPSPAQVKAALYNWKSHVSTDQVVEGRLRSRMRSGLNVILGSALTDKLFLCYGPRVHEFDSGVADPCVNRAYNFMTHLPIRNHNRLDFKIVAVGNLVDETVSDSCLDLNKLYLVSRQFSVLGCCCTGKR